MTDKVTIFWFRRDLRLEDNCGLYHAHREDCPVQPVFIFDSDILDGLENKKHARVEFIHRELARLQDELRQRGASMDVRTGKPLEVWKSLCADYAIHAVWANRDYEPYARKRDREIYEFLQGRSIPFKAVKDHVIFEKDEILKSDGAPYRVYTPYSKAWRKILTGEQLRHCPSEEQKHWANTGVKRLPGLRQLGFEPAGLVFPAREPDERIIGKYHETRDIPSLQGTTRMGVHLRFGTVSIRMLAGIALHNNDKYLDELTWRDFYQAILWHYPHVTERNFDSRYDGVRWSNNREEFKKWCTGTTGYPLVDAGMRQLNNTGYMHNRLRMITASFLTKHLLIDWRWGEGYFAEKLLDYELASNNGGWQWAAGTGVDAAPYFRIFNPYTQADKFDRDRKYIRRWVPEYDTPDYPPPMVDHKAARERTLNVYRQALAANLSAQEFPG